MDKEAIIPELARLGSHIVGRSSAATAATEGAVRGSIGRLQAGAKGFLNAPIKGTPEIMPAAARGFVRKATDVAIENPALALGFATPVPFGGPLLYGAQKVVEKGINKLVPPKLAFAVSQYSGALNPVIHSGASVIPPFKAPRLDVAVQKAAFAQTYSAGPSPDWAHGPATAASDIPPFRAPRLDKAIQKSAAGAPTRGNFMMASDVPPFKAPRLDRAIQKDGAYESEPYTSIFKGAKLVKLEGDAIIECDKQGKSLGKGNLLKEKDSDALPDGLALQPWDNFKRSKYAMPTEKLAEFVEGLRKEAIPGLTPQSRRLEQSTRIGAPRATPPPGPSIAMQSKPTGFGTPIAGAQKGSIGGGSFATSGMKPPPQIGMG